MSFADTFEKYNWDAVTELIYRKTADDVQAALAKRNGRTMDDFAALISPQAAAFLEPMVQQSAALTQKRFGKVIQLYAPMYLSNECQNICTYCGFSLDNPMKRTTLNDEELVLEAKAIKALGYDHILLVTGEANKTVGLAYFENALKILKPYFTHIAIEVQPLDYEEYKSLIDLGLHTVLVYQETYHADTYKQHHPKGKKSNFGYRLDTPDRLGKAGIKKIGLGCLIGLEEWRTDCFFTALHLQYLQKTYWQSKYSISFPRLRPYTGCLQPKSVMDDRELLQLIAAYRLFNADVELSLSTREDEHFRNNIIGLGITSMSAGSKTNPGGYAVYPESLEQFEISDDRPVPEMVQVIKQRGYEPVFTDWV